MKRTKKSLCLLLLVMCFAVSTISALSVSASATEQSAGMTFAADKYFDMEEAVYPEGNITFEAELWFDVTAAATQAPGFMISNYTNSTTKYSLTLDIQKGGKVRIHTQHSGVGLSKNSSSVTFATVLDESYLGTKDAPKYAKISVTVDVATGDAFLYINGEYKEAKNYMGSQNLV